MFCTFSQNFHDIYLHFFLFLGQMGRAGQKNKRIIKTYVFAMFFWNFGFLLCPFILLLFQKKTEKCEINCRPSVLRSPTVRCLKFIRNFELFKKWLIHTSLLYKFQNCISFLKSQRWPCLQSYERLDISKTWWQTFWRRPYHPKTI